MKKFIGYFFIFGLCCIITLLYYTFYIKLYLPLLLTEPNLKWVVLLGHIFLLLQLWCLISMIFSEPGTVPPYWGFYQSDNESRRKRYCMLCHVFKPERCHHCSVCNRCVLNMDHHCPWINNCVGFFNRKTFVLLLLYSLLNLYYMFLFMCPIIIDSITYLWTKKAAVNLDSHLLYIGVFCFIMFLMIILTMFTRFHLRLVLGNSTTIENFDKSQPQFSYNLGTRKNWLQVFGNNPWLWWVPIYGNTGKPVGDGVLWPQTFSKGEVREGFDDSEQNHNNSVVKVELAKAADASKLSDSDTSFAALNKKSKEIDLRGK